jgi:hypothetical protein
MPGRIDLIVGIGDSRTVNLTCPETVCSFADPLESVNNWASDHAICPTAIMSPTLPKVIDIGAGYRSSTIVVFAWVIEGWVLRKICVLGTRLRHLYSAWRKSPLCKPCRAKPSDWSGRTSLWNPKMEVGYGNTWKLELE